MRSYLKTKSITRQQDSLIFKFRTRMINVKCNFKNSNLYNFSCPVCRTNEDDNQQHLIFCWSLTNQNITLSEYNTLFGQNETKMEQVIRKLDIILKERNDILETMEI